MLRYITQAKGESTKVITKVQAHSHLLQIMNILPSPPLVLLEGSNNGNKSQQ